MTLIKPILLRRVEAVGTGSLFLACARSPFRPLLPSACYAGYHSSNKDLGNIWNEKYTFITVGSYHHRKSQTILSI